MGLDWTRPALREFDPAVRDAVQRLVALAEEHGATEGGRLHLGRAILEATDEAAGLLSVRLITPLTAPRATRRFARTLAGDVCLPAAWLRSLLAQLARDVDPAVRRLAARCARRPIEDLPLPGHRAVRLPVQIGPGPAWPTEVIFPPLVLRFRVEGHVEGGDT
jgi:hypothetical protein